MGFPINIHIGSTGISSHIVLEMLAYFLGFRYYLYLKSKSKEKISAEDRMWLIIAGAVGALVGSRMVGFFGVPVSINSVEDFFIHWMMSKSILGGLLGGIIGVEIAKSLMKIKIYTGDLFVYPIILGMIIGRLGCFSQGIYDGTHGIPSNLPWAMNLGDGIPRHPAQLYEIIFLGFIWIILKRLESRLSDGSRFKVFIISYIFFRFFIEWLKPVYFYKFGLSAAQVACLGGFIYYIPVLIKPHKLFKE